MPFIENITAVLDDREICVAMPDSKAVIVMGDYRDTFLHVVESLLCHDNGDYYENLDEQHGFEYEAVDMAAIQFSDSCCIEFDGYMVQVQDVEPEIYVVRYTGDGSEFRSFYLSPEDSLISSAYGDARRYPGSLSTAQWVRLIDSVNSVLGFEFVSLSDGKLNFDIREDADIPAFYQKLVYLLLAESYLIPEGFRGVFLLSDVEDMDISVQVKLLSYLGKSENIGLVLSTVSVDEEDIQEYDNIAMLET